MYVVDVLLLIKKRPPPTPPKTADVSSEDKVSPLSSFWEEVLFLNMHIFY